MDGRTTGVPAAEVREGDRAVIFTDLELVRSVQRTGEVVRIAGATTSLSLRADELVEVEQ